MALKPDVEGLRDTTLAALTGAHDNFVYTKMLWEIADRDVRNRGRRIVLRNAVTGSRVSKRDLAQTIHASTTDYLPQATIQQFASLTETFLTDLLRLWLTAYPAHLKGQVDVQVIVAAADKAAMLRPLIDQVVLGMAYKRPAEWFKQLDAIVTLNCPGAVEIEQFAEFKATRDVFAHNRGIVSQTYLDKTGPTARAPLGNPLQLPDSYLHDSWRLCRKIVADVGTAATAKA
jgi:hypothetical protein